MPFQPLGAATCLAVSMALVANAAWLWLIDCIPYFDPVSGEVILRLATRNGLADDPVGEIPSLPAVLGYFISLYVVVVVLADAQQGRFEDYFFELPQAFNQHGVAGEN